MDMLDQIGTDASAALDADVFATLGCLDHGIVVLQGTESWGAHERGYIELPTAQGPLKVPLAYDEREAPYAVDADRIEQCDLLLSLSDENDCIACVWGRVPQDSQLQGVGIDLCARTHFEEREGRRDFSLLLFTPEERELIGALDEEDPLYAKAVLFAAKEAAFKASAAPLRRWYDHHDKELLFEVRHFVMEEPGLERGTARNGAAQAALDAMGVARVQVHHTRVGNMALVVACALSR